MTTQALMELQEVPQKQTDDTEHHVCEVLAKTRLKAPSLCHLSSNSTILKKNMVPKMSASNFLQDGVPREASPPKSPKNSAGIICQYSGKSMCHRLPGSSPDLKALENLWEIL